MPRRRSTRSGPCDTSYATRTPRTRNLTQAKLPIANRESGIRFQELVCFKKWHVHRVSPLVFFSYEAKKLQEYSQILQSYLEIGQKKNGAALVGQHSSYSVVISVIKGVACIESDHDAVRISISPRVEHGETAKTVFTGILLSVERETQYDSTLQRKCDMKNLPVLLTDGSPGFTKIVLPFLAKTLGCIIKPLVFSSYNLMWMLAMWAINQYEDGSRPLMLEYSVPYKELHTIQYTLDAKTIKAVWCRIHPPNSNLMHKNEVEDFIKSLEEHFWVLFKVDLSNYYLCSVGTPAAAVHSNGSIKILNPHAVRHIFRHLTSLAQEIGIY